MNEEIKKPTRHKVGCTRTIRTAVMVCEYLRERCCKGTALNPTAVHYVFTNPSPDNGFWSADIIVDSWDSVRDQPTLTKCVEVCRAFVAGAGEIWT